VVSSSLEIPVSQRGKRARKNLSTVPEVDGRINNKRRVLKVETVLPLGEREKDRSGNISPS